MGRFEEGHEKGIYFKKIWTDFASSFGECEANIKSVQAYYDKLYSSLHRANVVDDMNAMKYFKRGLNPNIIAAIEGKYFRSMQDLLSSAIREEKEIVKVQQDKTP